MMKRFLLLGASLSIVACSSTPYLDDYLDSVDVPKSYIYFDHSKHGLMSNQQEPLKREFERCNQVVFNSVAFKLAEYEVNDVSVLEKVNHDYHAFLLESVMMSGGEGSEAFRALYQKSSNKSADSELSRSAFGYTEGLELPLKKLTRLILKRNRCLANKGWFYKSFRY